MDWASVITAMTGSLSARRAWIEIKYVVKDSDFTGSLSARRAWIEIIDYIIDYATDASLSARRAWIEMDWASVITAMTSVALRKESVDRNHSSVRRCLMSVGRSPQGERG